MGFRGHGGNFASKLETREKRQRQREGGGKGRFFNIGWGPEAERAGERGRGRGGGTWQLLPDIMKNIAMEIDTL